MSNVPVARLEELMEAERAALDHSTEQRDKILERAAGASRDKLTYDEQEEYLRHHRELGMHKYAFHLLRDLIKESI